MEHIWLTLGRHHHRGAVARGFAVAVALGLACSLLMIGTPTGPAAARSRPVPATALGQPAPPGSGSLAAVSCGTPAVCWAVGPALSDVLTAPVTATTVVIDATVDGGLHWRAEKVAVAHPTDLTDIDCPDRHDCMAVGTSAVGGAAQGAVVVTSDGGRRWSAAGAPSGAQDLAAVHCTAAGDCLVIAGQGTTSWSASTADRGLVWQRTGTLPPGFGGVSGVTCPDDQSCMTAGYMPTTPGKGTGAIAVTSNAGMTWSAAALPAGTGLLHGVACIPDADCVAVGTTSTTLTDVVQGRALLLASTNGGTSWFDSMPPAGVDDAFGIACPSAADCASVGTMWTPTKPPTPVGAVFTTTDGGTSWRAATARYIPVGLTAVVCPTTTACVAVGNDVLARVVLPPGGHGH